MVIAAFVLAVFTGAAFGYLVGRVIRLEQALARADERANDLDVCLGMAMAEVQRLDAR